MPLFVRPTDVVLQRQGCFRMGDGLAFTITSGNTDLKVFHPLQCHSFRWLERPALLLLPQ